MKRSILCFGDSNTHGSRAVRHPEDRRRLPADARWPGVMAGHLGEDWTIIEEGLPGRTSVFDDPIEGAHKNGQRMLKGLLETHRDLDLVIIMLGTNDLKSRFSATAEDIARGLERLVIEVSSSDAGPMGAAPTVLLVAPVPIEETGAIGDIFAGGKEKSNELGGRVATVADRQSAAFLDLAGVAQVDPLDGIHLDEQAHRSIGLAMAGAVRAIDFPD